MVAVVIGGPVGVGELVSDGSDDEVAEWVCDEVAEDD
jgi:hypothetical protein